MISSIRNFFALIGLLVIAGLIFALIQLGPIYHVLSTFDDKALDTYSEIAHDLIQTGNLAESTVWKVPVTKGLSPETVEETMKSVATEHNVKHIGELSVHTEIQAITGKAHRYLKIFMFCNAMTVSRLAAYNDAFAAYLPCRISLLEDKDGKLWLYAHNMDSLIYGGKPLPPALREEMAGISSIMLDIMHRGAKGEF